MDNKFILVFFNEDALSLKQSIDPVEQERLSVVKLTKIHVQLGHGTIAQMQTFIERAKK